MSWEERRSGLIVPEEYGDDEQCERCGCSQYDACYEGEPWREPGLCALRRRDRGERRVNIRRALFGQSVQQWASTRQRRRDLGLPDLSGFTSINEDHVPARPIDDYIAICADTDRRADLMPPLLRFGRGGSH